MWRHIIPIMLICIALLLPQQMAAVDIDALSSAAIVDELALADSIIFPAVICGFDTLHWVGASPETTWIACSIVDSCGPGGNTAIFYDLVRWDKTQVTYPNSSQALLLIRNTLSGTGFCIRSGNMIQGFGVVWTVIRYE